MKIQFGNVGFTWCCKELMDGLCEVDHAIRYIAREVVQSRPEDSRTLFVVMACPCCERTGIPQDLNGVVLVTPYQGIDRDGNEIKMIDIKPPFRGRDGSIEAKDTLQFGDHWRRTLEDALK